MNKYASKVIPYKNNKISHMALLTSANGKIIDLSHELNFFKIRLVELNIPDG